jgi:purine-nucleoside phosphorylase
MSKLKENIKEAGDFVKDRMSSSPRIGIILGTGLGALAKEIKDKKELPYSEIPYFPKPTVATHAGNLVFGRIGKKEVVAMEGRFHFYEGYSMKEITFPVRVMKALGVKILIVSNAAGGMNPGFRAGDIVLISDHINLMGGNPLIGPNDNELGPRFPDMSEPYSRRLIKIAEEAALREKIQIKKGVYAGVSGPNLETAAEYRFLRAITADMVGMSTVPEVIVACHAGMEVCGISCITDECFPDTLKPADIKEIIKIASRAEPIMTRLIKELITSL